MEHPYMRKVRVKRRNRWGAHHKRSDNLAWKEWRAQLEMIYEPERMSMNERLIEVLKKRETKMSQENTAENTETIVPEESLPTPTTLKQQWSC